MLNILLLVLLIGVNALLAMSEIALVTSRRARLQSLESSGAKGASRALELNEDPTRALSTIQVGITSIGILSGIVGEAALSEPVARWLVELGVGEVAAERLGIVLVVVVVTYFSIVLGELVPKRLGQIAPEAVACRVAPPLHWVSVVAKPFVELLSLSTTGILRLVRADAAKGEGVTEEEIHAMIAEGEESGVIDRSEREMVRNVFRLDDRQVGSLMTPRTDIEWINLEDPIEVNKEVLKHARHSRLPVCMGGLEDVRGIGSTFTLLQQMIRKERPDLSKGLVAPLYVPETLTGMELLDNFRKTDASLALVVDEYGEVQGVVTPRDVLEAIAGEFATEIPEESFVFRREDGSYLLDGMIAVPEMQDVLDLKHVPAEDEPGRYNTLAGMIMFMLGRMPGETDVVTWDKWRFEIVDMDGRRIDKVLVTPIQPVSPAAIDVGSEQNPARREDV